MKISTYRKQLLSIHSAQVKAFQTLSSNLLKEFGKVEEAEKFASALNQLTELCTKQYDAASSLFAVAATLSGEGNQTPKFWQLETGGQIYEFFKAKTAVDQLLADMDEFNRPLECIAAMRKERPTIIEAAEASRINLLQWRLAAASNRTHSLMRTAEAVTATEDAIFRSFGLRFWQGRKGYARFEGDRVSA